jgi:hypothetical protein
MRVPKGLYGFPSKKSGNPGVISDGESSVNANCEGMGQFGNEKRYYPQITPITQISKQIEQITCAVNQLQSLLISVIGVICG